MRRLRNLLDHLKLPALFALAVFVVMLVAMALVFGPVMVAENAEGAAPEGGRRVPLLAIFVACLGVGLIVSVVVGRRPLRPIQDIMVAADAVTAGDYSVRVEPSGTRELRQLGEKFNAMTEELGSVEMLRSDFVDNFSHEFKTPIVSLSGFAELLKRDDLTPEEREEYLDIIIDESHRLTDLASNVLLLSKVESLAALEDVARVDVTEQVRRAVILLEAKWSAKGLAVEVSDEDVFTQGNAELLEHVWVNLVDNAVKFSPVGASVQVRISQNEEFTNVTVENEGTPLTDFQLKHVFDRFYQADGSHATQGNGLGLSLVKHIVRLHGGQVCAMNLGTDRIAFAVTLPRDGVGRPATDERETAPARTGRDRFRAESRHRRRTA